MVEVLGPLSARPPTPPRTTSRMLPNEGKTEDSPAALQTPDDSPFSANGSAAPSSRHSKKVEFSPWARYIKPPTFANSTLKSQADLKALPPSNECKPSKSILKATQAHAPVNSPNAAPFTPESFAMLLESITQQLAGESTSSRLDAYMQFFGALRAYDGLPDGREISGKLGLITQFIQRDVTRDIGNAGPLDTNLVTQALKLSAALIWHHEISVELPDDFKVFLVEHTINCLQDAKVSKSVLTSCMPILSTHTFPTRIMTTARITRLLAALHDVTSRVNGSSIVTQRLSIYQRILSQSKTIFVSQASLWMEHLISGLLHHIKDTRLKAISLGFHISTSFGPNPTLSKTIREIFDRPLEKDRKMISEIRERMSRMMGSVDSGVHVPQVWSVIILLLRNKRSNIDQWEHFKEWVLVLQKCFNCSEPAIKAQAMVGWNRFVFVISPGETTSPSMVKMLSRPILSQLERKKSERSGSQPSQVALSSYYNLLYYAFRPSVPSHHLDVVWDEYVASPSAGVFASGRVLTDRFAQVLSNMLWSSQTKVWSENKVNESSKLDPEELPSIDCRWTRSRITSVLRVFENILKASVWIDEDIDKSNIAAAWISLSRALSYASSKEITPSPESMQAVASMLGLLQRIWNAGPSSLNASDDSERFFDRFRFLSTTIIFSLGSIPFTEKLLFKTAETFQAATPTHRERSSNLDSPILHFLRLISDVNGISEPTPAYMSLINRTLEAACNGRNSRGSRLELLQQCADLYPNEAEFHFGVHNYAQIVWKSTAQLAADSLCSFPIESARERDGSVLRDYENIIKVLSAGLKFSDSQVWNQLLDAFVRVVRTEKGDWAIAMMITEPLADCVMRLRVRDAFLPSTSLLNHSLSIPYSHQAMSNESQNTSLSGTEQLLFPYKLVELVDRTLRESYGGFDASETNGIADFIESLTSFLGSGALAFRSSLLESIQQPLALWLRDEARQLNVECGVESRILTAIRALSSAVLNILQTSSPHDASCLQKFETIICAGLDSSHVSIAKRFVEVWRSTFGLQESLACPMSISRALVKLELYLKRQASGSQDRPDGELESRYAYEHPVASVDSYKASNSFGTSESAGFQSSPVTRFEPAVGSEQIERRPLRPEDAEKLVDDDSLVFSTGSESRSQRNEVFSMIEGLRSSSPPANTPRELGFMTPPHLRNLRNAEASDGTPLTPTLPGPAENEDNFLGSSPTPGTRTRTQASGSELSSALSEPNMDIMQQDPPSSPPEVKSVKSNDKPQPSPRPQDKNSAEGEGKNKSTPTRSQLRRQKKAAGKKENVVPKDKGTPTDKRSKRRTRSSASGNPINDSEPASSSEKVSQPTPVRNAESGKEKASSKPADDVPVEVSKTNEEVPDISDSLSDDMETQIASQLEQDMGLVANVNEKPANEKSEALQQEPPQRAPATRKRKREVEGSQEAPQETPSKEASSKDRRRSSRFSSTQTSVTEDSQESRSTRPTKFQDHPVVKSPSVSSSKRRKVKGDANESTDPNPTKDQDSGIAGKAEDLAPSSKKRRRSTRIGGEAVPPNSEETPSETPNKKKSSRSNRSRRKDGQGEAKPQDPLIETKDAEVATETSQEKGEDQPSMTKVQEPESHKPVHEVSESLVDPTGQQPQAEPEPAPEQDIQMTTEQAHSEAVGDGPQAADNAIPEKEAESNDSGILDSLRKILDDAKSANLDRNTVKQIDELLFDIRVETLEAMRRHTG